MDSIDPMLLLGGLTLAGGAVFALAMMLRRPNLPPPQAVATLQTAARSPQPGELGQQLQDLHQRIVDRHDSQALEAMIGAAGSQLQSNPLFRAMQGQAAPAAPPKPPSA